MGVVAALAVAVALAGPPAAAPVRAAWVPPLPRPLAVVRGFDPPAVRWAAGHRGVDLAAPAGSAVRATGAGRVSFASRLAGRGVVVVVHGELRSTYEPVTATVQAGASVAAGDPIGRLDPGHDPAGPAAGVLHWGLRRGEAYLDPMSLLSAARPVRLLPHLDTEPLTDSDRGTTGPSLRSADVAAPAPDRPQRSRTPPVAAYALGVAALTFAAVAVTRRPP